jgi:hypothetical protein
VGKCSLAAIMVRYLLRFAVAWGQFGSGLVDLILTIYTNSFCNRGVSIIGTENRVKLKSLIA